MERAQRIERTSHAQLKRFLPPGSHHYISDLFHLGNRASEAYCSIGIYDHVVVYSDMVGWSKRKNQRRDRMKFRIEYTDRKFPEYIIGRKNLLDHLKNLKRKSVADIRKIYKSGVSDSVLEKYGKYMAQGETA